MTSENTYAAKKAVLEKLDTLPNGLMSVVSEFLDSLLYTHQKTTQYFAKPESTIGEKTSEEKNPETGADSFVSHEFVEPFASWDDFFDAAEELPPVEEPPLSSMTKQERRDLLTQILIEKYKRKGIDFS